MSVALGDGAGGLVHHSYGPAFGSYSAVGGLPVALPGGIFSDDRFDPIATTPGGAVPLPATQASIYIIGNVVNQSNAPGTFDFGGGPSGGSEVP